MLVPTGQAIALVSVTLLFSISTAVPISSSALLVFKLTWATAAMDAKASPRKPMVLIWNRSSMVLILLVA